MPASWEKPAELMLDRRDRFTRPKIAKEFEHFSEVKERLFSGSIAFDPDNDGYLTPVADHTYSVVWYLEDDQPVVHAVVPTARFRSGADLKERLAEIVREASNNLITLR
jgi:hypothetical protein